MKIRKLIIQALLQTGNSGVEILRSSSVERGYIGVLLPVPLSNLNIPVDRRAAWVHISVSQMFCLNFCDGVRITSEFLSFLRVPLLILGNIFLEVLIQ